VEIFYFYKKIPMKLVSPLLRGILLVVLLLTSNRYIQAQDEKAKFGKVSMEDLKMTRYDKDSMAEAVILTDIGSTYFDYDKDKGFVLTFDRFERIKILTKEGYKFASNSIPLYRVDLDEEKLITLKACTFNLADKKIVETKMDNGSVFEERADINWTLKKFTLPAVKEGSVIDIHYTIQSPFFINLQPWSFQDVIPERYSEYEVRIPEYFHYKKQVSGFQPFWANETNSQTITKTFQQNEIPNDGRLDAIPGVARYDLTYKENMYKLATKDVPAMKDEKYTSSMKNYSTRVEFELDYYQFPNEMMHDLTSTWEKIVHKMLMSEDFGSQLKKTGIVKEVAETIKRKTSDPVERMVLAYDYIRTNMKWNNWASKYPTTNLRKAFNEGKGNSADINLNLILLLKELGINADPVLLSTRSNGQIRESAPNYSRINYVIACADIAGKKHLLDATDLNRPYTMLPTRCLNGQGILAIEDSVQWIDLLTQEKSNTMHFGEFRINSEGRLEGKMNVAYDGFPACDEREELHSKGDEKFVTDLKEAYKNTKLDSIQIEHRDLLTPMKLSYTLQSQELTQATADMIFFNVLLGMGETTNPFTLEKREYPVDIGYPIKDTYIFVIDVPDGYSVETLPQKVTLALPENAGTYKFSVTQVGNKIAVNSIFNLTKTFFVMSEYPDLREFFTRMLAKQAEKIVIKKS
jgi:transglutaminase-like putative cysteine protease